MRTRVGVIGVGRALVAATLAALAALGACSDDPSRPPPAGPPGTAQPGSPAAGAGSGDRPATDGGSDGGADADAGACTTLVNDGPRVDELAVPGDPPPLVGGTIEAGEYLLTDAVVYVGLAGVPGVTVFRHQSVLRVTGTTLERVIRSEGGAAPTELHERATFVVSGTSLTQTQSCPGASTVQYAYSATPTRIVLSNLLTRQAHTYERR